MTKMNTIYKNELFRRLIQQYPTPSELFAYLRSAEGGALTVVDTIATPESPFALIRYDKSKSNFGVYHVPFFRSVVWDIRAHRPVSIAPRRSTPITEGCPDANFYGNYTVEEFVDGVMIQMWWYGNDWMIATRSNIGAQCSFYGKRPYAELFWTAMEASNVPPPDVLDKKFVYSWVLQHPEERIVVQAPYAIPRVRLVELSEITPTNEHLVYEDMISQLDPSLQTVCVERHAINSMKECHDRVKIWGQRYKTGWQGLVIKGLNLSGDCSRWKIRSEEYMRARALRGNQAKREFTWLDHWTKGSLYDYLKIYAEEDVDANRVIAAFKTETQRVYDFYMDVYFNHKIPLGQVPAKYRKCLWELKEKNTNRYFGHVRDYMNGLDTARKLWLLNFDRRFPTATENDIIALAPPVLPADVDI
jgi:hypothetical protein